MTNSHLIKMVHSLDWFDRYPVKGGLRFCGYGCHFFLVTLAPCKQL